MSRPSHTIYYRIGDIDELDSNPNQHVELYYQQGGTTPVKAAVAVLQWERNEIPNFESYETVEKWVKGSDGNMKSICPMTKGGVAYALTYVLLQEVLNDSVIQRCTIKSAHGGVLAMKNIDQFELDGAIKRDPMAKTDVGDLIISTREGMVEAMDILRAKLDQKYNGVFTFLEMPPEKKKKKSKSKRCKVLSIDLAKGSDTAPTASGLDDLIIALESMEKRHQTERKALIQKIKVLEKQLRRDQAQSSSSSENEKEIWV